MKKPQLVILAAGMGSRYGGLKQIDAVDRAGHIIIDYSIYDAIRAGFRDFVFIIKKEIEHDFREVMDSHLKGKDINVKYVFQELDKIPSEFSVPGDRRKPWGTAHAIICTDGVVDAPFAVINADDYYGVNAYKQIYDFLDGCTDGEKYNYALVGYKLGKTVSKTGSVSRGVCRVEDGYLSEIVERTNISTDGERIYMTVDGEQIDLDPDTTVSMNLWGFTPSYIKECKKRFNAFLDKGLKENPLKCEFYLPGVVSDLMSDSLARVKVTDSMDQWYGVTYKEDKPVVTEALEALIDNGTYPENF